MRAKDMTDKKQQKKPVPREDQTATEAAGAADAFLETEMPRPETDRELSDEQLDDSLGGE